MKARKAAAPVSPPSLGLPRLSDEAAVEVYLFVEQLFQLVDRYYGAQVMRHFRDLDRDSLLGPAFDCAGDDPPF